MCGTVLLLVPRAGLLLQLHLMPDWQRELAHVPCVSWQQYLSSTELATRDFLQREKKKNLPITRETTSSLFRNLKRKKKRKCLFIHSVPDGVNIKGEVRARLANVICTYHADALVAKASSSQSFSERVCAGEGVVVMVGGGCLMHIWLCC